MAEDNLYEKAEKRADEKIDFYKHLLGFVVINVILFVINLIFSPNHWWFYWVTIIAGIVLVVKFLKDFVLAGRFSSNENTSDKNVDFYHIFLNFVVANVFLIIINVLVSPNHWWFYWVTIIWGILLVIQYLRFGLS